MRSIATVITGIFGVLWVSHTHAAVPELIPLQGILTDRDGEVLDGPTDLRFAIFDAETEGTELWWNERVDYNLERGFFIVYLGEVTPLPVGDLIAAEQLWLEIAADGDVMSRTRLASVPFALEAQKCQQVGSLNEGDIQTVLKGACGPGQYVENINPVTGEITCSTPPDNDTKYDGRNFAKSGHSCAGGQYMTGIDANGLPICASLNAWINDHCYVYFGWRDSCDGCNSAPSKYGRTRGNTTSGCSSIGADGSCQNFTISGQTVRMYGVNTDGDVNGDDKFWIGIKCQ